MVKILRFKERHHVLVKDFGALTSDSDESIPAVAEMNQLMRENPTYTKAFFSDKSSWGYSVFRPATDKEMEEREADERKTLQYLFDNYGHNQPQN